MSANPSAIKGRTAVHVKVRAKPGKVDELVAAFLKVKESVESDAEPDGISFNVCKFGDEILIFEQYKNAAALGPHSKTEAIKALQKVLPELKDGELECSFYEEITSKAKL